MFKFKSMSAAWNFVQGMWLAFVASMLLFLFVAYQITMFRSEGYGLPLSTAFSMPIMYLFSILGLVSLIGGIIIYRKLPATFFRKMAKKIARGNAMPNPEQSRIAIIKAIFVLPIVIASFLMSCEIYGFIPVIIGADFSRMLPFAGVSLVAMIVLWPRRGLKNRIIARIEGMTGIDAAAIDLGLDVTRRASRVKVIAFSLIVLWLLIQIVIDLFLRHILGQSSRISIPESLVALGAILFWGLLAWRFQKFGGLSLIILGSFGLVVTTIGIIRDNGLVWQFLAFNIFFVSLLIAAGILFYIDYRRKAKEAAKSAAGAA
jgi:hypothetical protein